jgi:hypothetical protein
MIARPCSAATLAKFGMLAMLVGISASSAQVNRAARPVAAPAGGDFTEPVSVSLTSPTEGASIFFTLDGSIPDTAAAGATLRYTDPIAIATTTQIKAIAFKAGAGWYASEVTTLVYTLIPPTTLKHVWTRAGGFPGRSGIGESSPSAVRPIACYNLKGSWLGMATPSALPGTRDLPGGKQAVILAPAP